MLTLAVFLRHIPGALLLGGKNLFQKVAHQFRCTVERVQIGLHFISEFMILLIPKPRKLDVFDRKHRKNLWKRLN